MCSIVTGPGGNPRGPTRRPKAVHLLRLLPVACLLAVAVPAMLTPSAGATSLLSVEQSKAAQIEAEIQQTGRQIDALDQRYEAALEKKASIDAQIGATRAQIGRSLARIAQDKVVLRKAAIEAYVAGGTSTATATLFSSNQTSAMDSSVYDQVVTGDLNTSTSDLRTAVAQLAAQRRSLEVEDSQAAGAVAAAHAAYESAQTLETQEHGALSQVKGEIATLVAQQQAVRAAAELAAARATIAAARATPQAPPAQAATAPAPTAPAAAAPAPTAPAPTAPAAAAPAATAPAATGAAGGGAGEIAVRAAETQLGVPYVWGAEDPGVGFDCSGLTAWAWSQAGVDLPHYSGSQMADSAPVPISDLQPGDLLFYGPGGSTHVAMYVGGGMMIEATLPGTVVRIDPVRFGTTFAGAGQP